MSRPRHYSPAIGRFLVSVLYHEAWHRKVPMTRLANDLLAQALVDSVGCSRATQLRSRPSPTLAARGIYTNL